MQFFINSILLSKEIIYGKFLPTSFHSVITFLNCSWRRAQTNGRRSFECLNVRIRRRAFRADKMAIAGVSGDRRALVARGVSRAAEFMGNISQDSLWCTGVTGGRRKFNSPRTNGRFIHGLVLRHFARPRAYFRPVHRVATYRFFFLEMANLAERDAIRCIIRLPRARPGNACDAACFDVSAKCRSRVDMSSTYVDDNYVIVGILVNCVTSDAICAVKIYRATWRVFEGRIRSRAG